MLAKLNSNFRVPCPVPLLFRVLQTTQGKINRVFIGWDSIDNYLYIYTYMHLHDSSMLSIGDTIALYLLLAGFMGCFSHTGLTV